MNLINTNIKGLVLLKPSIYTHLRGCFLESYNKKHIENFLGPINFIQDNESKSSKGVLRGLHFQKPPFSQAKLIRCVSGKVLDVALDLRKNSVTYGHYESTILSGENKNILFIPKGFAHGFLVLSDSAVISYKVDNYYNPKYESGILWNDPCLGIDWGLNHEKIIISEKDKSFKSFNKFKSPFL